MKIFIKLAGLAAGALLLAIATAALVKHEMTKPDDIPDEGVLSYLAPIALWLAELPGQIRLSLASPLAFNLIVSDRFPGHTGFVGEPNKEERYLLLSRADGDIGQGIVELIDLRTFEVKHTWRPDLQGFVDAWNKQAAELHEAPQFIEPFELAYHPMMVSDGLIFNAFYSTMKKVDACSQPVWQITPSPTESFHHSLELDIDGNIWSLGENPNRLPPPAIDGTPNTPYRDSSIVKLNSDGQVLFVKSISDILSENGLGFLMWGNHATAYSRDWIHANEAQPALSDTEYWKKGDVLISMRSPSLVLLYRPSSNELIWHTLGYMTAQHDPDFIDDSRISIFDNNSPFFFEPKPPVNKAVIDETIWSDGHNQVVIYDFSTQKYSTYLDEGLRMHRVKTEREGRSDILPNGDLFVEETEHGRTLYFNADGSLRWSHVNRATDGNVYIVAWSRMLYRDHEIAMVRDFLENKDERLAACGEP